MQFADIINTIGVSLILLAFFLLTIRKVKSNSFSYLIMNMAGAGMACYGSWLIDAIPFMVLEGIWSLVASMGLIRALLQRKANQREVNIDE